MSYNGSHSVNWRQCTIADLGEVVTGKTPSTKNPEFWDGRIHFITPKDIQGLKRITKTERTITDSGLQKVKGSILPQNAVCVSCIGNIGYTGITTRPCVTNQQINSIIANEDNAPDFVYYLMRSLWPFFKKYEGQSTTLSILNKTQFSKIVVSVPDLHTQKQIAGVLSVLDAKIETNTQINANLQQQAAAVYLDWCSQCEDTVQIGEIVDNILDYTPCAFQEVVLINSSEVTEGHFDHHSFSKNANLKGHFKKRFKKYDILYSEIRPKNKHYAFVLFNADKYIASTRLMVLRAKKEFITPSLLYQHLSSSRVCDEFAATTETRSGTFPQGCYADFSKIEVPHMPLEKQHEITSFLNSIYTVIEHNDRENRRLALLRDTLLPKFISGEIDVSDIQY